MSNRRILRHGVLMIAALVLVLPSAAAPPAWQTEFADDLYAAWTSGNPKPQLSQTRASATLDEAYAVQGLFVKRILRDDAIGGFKAAVVGEAGQRGLGIPGPLTTVVPKSGLLRSSDQITIELANEPVRFLETEIGYLIAKDISAPVPDVAALKQHIRSIVAVIEVPGGASENVEPVTAGDLVARNIDSMAVILGPEHDLEAIDPDTVSITLKRGEAVVNSATGDLAAGGQWETLRKTVNTLVGQGYTIEAGQFITNGALGSIQRAEPGTHTADFGVLGSFTFTVVDTGTKE